MASATEIMDQYVRDSRYGTSSKVPQAGKKEKKKGPISDGGTASLNKKSSGSGTMSFKKLFDRM
jgi:hypothetical protein